MQFRAKQIAPPKEWALFEDLCHALFKQVWKDSLAQKNGRKGQPQHGVDVFGSPRGIRSVYQGVQCKGKDANYRHKPSLAELKAEIAKAEKFSPKLERWIFATTAPSDGILQKAAREISVARHACGLFTLDVLGWEEIQALLADAPNVIAEFYPEHADNLPTVIDTLQALPSREEALRLTRLIEDLRLKLDGAGANTHSQGLWQPVEFEIGRDLGPALMGRSLGPADAVACPRLVEADALLAQLKMAFSARIVGEPGAGKSVCAYQAAMTLAKSGCDVFRLTDPQALGIALEKPVGGPKLFLIDNAHLMQPHVLKTLEDETNANRLVLSIHNAVEGSDVQRGLIALDAKRAVKTIASALRANFPATLEAVRRADDQIGERMMDVDLGQRIDLAEQQSQLPWQFCFILGGGWRRAKQAADAARAAGADIVLAAIAMRQLASRDANALPAEIVELCRREDIPEAAVMAALSWLEGERLVLSKADCRCPHQRFASVVLMEILVGQNKDGRDRIGRIADEILCSEGYPLAGLRLFLNELRFGSGNHRWTWIIQGTTVHRLADRCWQVTSGEDRAFAALALEALSSFSDAWASDLIAPHAPQFSAWISNPAESAYGFGYLLNYLVQHDVELAKAIVSASDPVAIADAFSMITPETAYGTCDLLRSIGSARVEDWNARMLAALDKQRFLKLAEEWTDPKQAFLYAYLCKTIVWWDDDLALQMAERFVPAVQSILANDAVEGFRLLDDMAMTVLRVFDVLGVYVGDLAPDSRRWAIARSMCAVLDPKGVARQMFDVRRRDFQSAAFFLHFLFRCAPRKFAAMLPHLDWQKLEATIGEEWANLPHEAEVLLGTLHSHPSGRPKLREFITRNLGRIEKFPPRLAIIAPEAAVEHAARGRPIRLAQYKNVDWRFGGLAVAVIEDARPDLVEPVFAAYEDQFAEAMSAPNSTFFDESEPMIRLLTEKAPIVAGRVLSKLNVEVAEKGLADCLGKNTGHRRAAALLVEAAIGLQGPTGQMARRLRQRFPKASIPPATSPLIVSRRKKR